MTKKKIISFSLWGNEPFYCEGAVNNAILWKKFLPDWVCRFYVDCTVPEDVVNILMDRGGEVFIKQPAEDVLGMFWRFDPITDETVERFIVRDTDCLPSEREVIAIREWEQSDKPFHTIRDNAAHGATILGGMWGAIPGIIPNFGGLVHDFLSSVQETSSQHSKRKYHGADQIFLHNFIWPIVKSNHLAHVRKDIPGLLFTGDEKFLPDLKDEHFIGMPCTLVDGKVVRVESHLLPCNKKEWKWKSICLMVPTYKRVPYLGQFVQSVLDTVDDLNNVRFSFCVNVKDKSTIDFINSIFKTPDMYEIIPENTRQPNLALYFNKMYDETKFQDSVVSMLGDDMEFKTKGWDTVILNEINNADGKVILYCDDDNTSHEKCAVNMFETRIPVIAQNKPYMCTEFHADVIDAIWTITGKMTGIIKYLPDIHIKHNHMSNFTAEQRDETFNRLEPIRQNAREKMGFAVAYATLCARNMIENGVGTWNTLM